MAFDLPIPRPLGIAHGTPLAHRKRAFLEPRAACTSVDSDCLLAREASERSHETRGICATLPLIFPPIALGYLLMVLLGQNGWIGGWLKAEWGIRVLFTPEAVILAAFVAGIPLVVRPLKAAFSDAKLRDLEAAASLCGLSPLKRFLLITVPLVRKPLAAAFILAAGRAIGEVGITMMLGGNIEDRTATVSLEIFNAVGRGDFDEATALCGVLAAISLCFYVLLDRLGASDKA